MEGATAAEHASRAADGPSADRIHKSSVSSSSNSPAGSSLNPRSCVTCRKRKVKCDKKHPCSNCTKQRIECIFPGPGRAPRKPRKPVDGELLERVRRLESVVKSFGGDADDVPELPKEREACAGSDSSPSGPSENKPTPEEEEKEEVYQKWKHKVAKFRSLDGGLERGREMSNLQNRFGRLVVDEGKSRYVNNSFWASLGEEVSHAAIVSDMRTLTDISAHRWKTSKPYSTKTPMTPKMNLPPPNRPTTRFLTIALSSASAQTMSICSNFTHLLRKYPHIGSCTKKIATP